MNVHYRFSEMTRNEDLFPFRGVCDIPSLRPVHFCFLLTLGSTALGNAGHYGILYKHNTQGF
jgi:hypothetical protein